jgi:Xaa-Pro aminopeptidase
VDRLAGLLAERGLDALIVTDLVNVRYLSGFTGTNGLCILGGPLRLFLTDFRYVERAEREVEGFDRVRGKQDLLGDAAQRVADAGLSRVGFEDDKLSVRQHGRLRDALAEGIELVGAGDVVEELRAVKDPAELRAIRGAAEIADGVYEHLRETRLSGRAELEVARDIERELRARGAEPAFPSIVAAGPNAALPHAEPGEDPIPGGTFVVVDLGCVVDGYCSDCTRTLATGEPSAEATAVYELVRDAQAHARAAVRAGAGCRELDSVARERIAAAGHGDRFGHGLGHGVGLEVHEAPRLSQAADGELRAGNVLTVEPGIYVPGEYGVRIEDLVVVERDGCEVLTHFPKELLVVG